jgi:hypothetical protein
MATVTPSAGLRSFVKEAQSGWRSDCNPRLCPRWWIKEMKYSVTPVEDHLSKTTNLANKTTLIARQRLYHVVIWSNSSYWRRDIHVRKNTITITITINFMTWYPRLGNRENHVVSTSSCYQGTCFSQSIINVEVSVEMNLTNMTTSSRRS